jgi:EpsD family peptidyl-prolyl cis-trans isomerase
LPIDRPGGAGGGRDEISLEPTPMSPTESRRRVRAKAALAVTALAALLVLAGCEAKKSAAGGQTAAKVNRDEVTVEQINLVLQQQRGLKPEQAQAASRQILERLIEQELAAQKAVETKIDRDPTVQLKLDAARREVLARAYFDKVGEAAAKPTPEEVAKYYDDNPALFKDRRIYSLQEIVVEARPEQVAELKAKLGETKNIAEFVEFLKANDYRFAANQAVRAAEQLPLASLRAIAGLQVGQALLNVTPNGATVVLIAAARSQPVTLDQARPAIEQFLLNERKRELVAKDLKAVREVAKVEYVGPFASAASAPLEAAASAPAVFASEPSVLPGSAGTR